MHMCRLVIVRIHNHPEPAESEDGRHKDILAHFPSGWVISTGHYHSLDFFIHNQPRVPHRIHPHYRMQQ